ncbi:hypothetical protein [Paenibacillus yonginensis]|nr:hypothetical protein [Paenibacillus yonginensis]
MEYELKLSSDEEELSAALARTGIAKSELHRKGWSAVFLLVSEEL